MVVVLSNLVLLAVVAVAVVWVVALAPPPRVSQGAPMAAVCVAFLVAALGSVFLWAGFLSKIPRASAKLPLSCILELELHLRTQTPLSLHVVQEMVGDCSAQPPAAASEFGASGSGLASPPMSERAP